MTRQAMYAANMAMPYIPDEPHTRVHEMEDLMNAGATL